MKTWTMGSRSYGVGDQEWFFIVDESDRIVARVHPAATETDEETGESCTGVADFAAIPDVRLMLSAPLMRNALADAAERFRHLHGLRLEGEPRPLDFSRELSVLYAALAKADGAA